MCSVALPVASKELVGLGRAERVAAHGVDTEQRDSGDCEDDVGAAPLRAEVLQQAGLAGGAGVAELGLLVAPGGAVGVGGGADGADPVRRGHQGVAAARGRLAAARLQRAHAVGRRREQVLRRGVRPVEVAAGGRGGQAGLDPVPACVQAGAQPARVVVQVVLEELPARHPVARRPRGHRQHQDDKAGQRHDDDQHGDEVDEEEPRQAPEGGHEAREPDREDSHAEANHWPLEDLDAGVVGLRRQPDARGDHGDGKQRAHQVDGGDAHVVERHVNLSCHVMSCWQPTTRRRGMEILILASALHSLLLLFLCLASSAIHSLPNRLRKGSSIAI